MSLTDSVCIAANSYAEVSMSLRPIKERKETVPVENDLRGLGSIVRDRPPQYELHIQILAGKEHEVKTLASKRGFRASPAGLGLILATPESVSSHEQAVWHFFLVSELFQNGLVSRAEVRIVHPTEALLTNGKDRKHLMRDYSGSQVVSFDSSIALYMMGAGYWKSHFSEEVIKKDVQEKGYSTINISPSTLAQLHHEIITIHKREEKEGIRNAG
jgi:hypothetical protein